MTTQQLMNVASNGIPTINVPTIPSTSSLVIQPLQGTSQDNSSQGQTSDATTSNIAIEKVESLNPRYVTAGGNSLKSDDILMSSLGCKPLEDTDSESKPEKLAESKSQKMQVESKLEKLASQLKNEALAKQKAGNEKAQNFLNSLSLKPKETNEGSKSGTLPTKNKRKNSPNGTDSVNVNGGDVKSEIKIEPIDMTVSLSSTSISAAALMSHFATTALGKSVGTTADMPEFINVSEFSDLSPKKGGKSKPMRSEDIDESVISKAVIKTPVKIKNDGSAGGDEETSVRFMTQYMCRYCAQRFDEWDKIKEHVSLHLKGKHTNHTCSVCGKEYRTPSKLQRHVRVHSGERPYACTVCGRRFTRSDHVKQHMKVHLPPQELNVCRLCGTRFLKRQSLQLHLQQAHLVNQLFTCNRCGEAFESLEQLNAHNLTHDSILNSMKGDGKTENPTLLGIAKFSVALNIKQVDGSKLFTKVDGQRPIAPKPQMVMQKIEPKPEPTPTDQDDTMKYNYILDAPENAEDVTKISDKLIAESIEEESKKYEELKRQIEEHSKLMAEEAAKREEALEREKKEREQAESKEIAAAFNIDRANHVGDSQNAENGSGDDPMDVSEYESPSVLTSEDGMSMYISTDDIMKLKGLDGESVQNSDGSDSNANEMEEYSELHIDEDGDNNDANENKMDTEKEQVNDLNKEADKEMKDGESRKMKTSVVAGSNKAAPYRPGPRWFKTAQQRNAVLNKQSDKILNVSKDNTPTLESSSQVSFVKPNINELLKAKVEQKNFNIVENDKISTPSTTVLGIAPGQPIHVPIAPQPQQQVQQYILVQPPPQATVTPVTPQTLQNSGMLKCEHCCIWFEDRAMALLHNTLHNADKNDPYTCRKCYKKMGNRLEFNAHLIWHLEPNMDL